VELTLVRGKLQSSWWRLAMTAAFLVSGATFLVHEQNAWFFQRSSFLHHALGWTLVAGAIFPFARSVRPRSQTVAAGLALTFVVISVLLYCDRDVAPIFGHIGELAGTPHR
jgi:peptidoglycan/LPS O-acetylase OafA/YrhL